MILFNSTFCLSLEFTFGELQPQAPNLAQTRARSASQAFYLGFLCNCRLYTDPNHLFCIRPTHQRSTTSRQPHDHGELGWAVYGILVGETVQQIYERLDDGSEPGRAQLRPLPPIRQRAGEVIIIPVGAPHAIIARTENWSVVIRSREMETAWRNWYDAEAGTVERKVFGYG